MNTFSEHGNDFVGRLLHEGGVRRRTFFAFSQYQKCLYGCSQTERAVRFWPGSRILPAEEYVGRRSKMPELGRRHSLQYRNRWFSNLLMPIKT